MTRSMFLSLALGATLLASAGCGKKSSPAQPVPQPLSIRSGDIVVTDSDSTGAGMLIAVDSTGVQRVLVRGGYLKYPSGLAFAQNGDVLVAEEVGASGLGGIYRVSRSSGAQSVITAGGLVRKPGGIAVASNGDIYVSCYVPDSVFGGGPGQSGTVCRVNPSTGAASVLTNRALTITYGVALEALGDLIVNTGLASAAVARVDPSTGADVVLSSSNNLVPLLLGVTLDGAGNIVVTGDGSGLVRINAVTGAQEVVSTGNNFVTPFGVAIDRAGRIAVADAGGSIIRVDPVNGDQTVIAASAHLSAPTGIAIVP